MQRAFSVIAVMTITIAGLGANAGPVPSVSDRIESVSNHDDWNNQISVTKAKGSRLSSMASSANPPYPQALASTSVGVTTADPRAPLVHILLTDPLGRRMGTDFATGKPVAEIPYSTLLLGDDSLNLNSAIFIEKAIYGEYTLEVLGIGKRGPLGLDIAFPNAFPNGWDATVEEFSGTIAPGQKLTFTFDTFAFDGITDFFTSFYAQLRMYFASNTFQMHSTFALNPHETISPATQPVTIELAQDFLITIPPGSFHPVETGKKFLFAGTVNGVTLKADLTPTGGNNYSLKIEGKGGPRLPDLKLVEIRLGIGNHAGSVSVEAELIN